MTYVVPTAHAKAEWRRLSQAAYDQNLDGIGHRYSGASFVPSGSPISTAWYDQLQTGYRLWLNYGFAEAAPFINQHIGA
jgi:hypothetical protein